jgi:hypothetical protein
MPTYTKVDNASWTIAPGVTLIGTISWEGIPGVGPNKGPLVIMADPKPGQAGQTKLITFDPEKCRRDKGEVFYQFKMRSESDKTCTFDLEIIDFQDLMH